MLVNRRQINSTKQTWRPKKYVLNLTCKKKKQEILSLNIATCGYLVASRRERQFFRRAKTVPWCRFQSLDIFKFRATLKKTHTHSLNNLKFALANKFT
jgi:hypothetical protein